MRKSSRFTGLVFALLGSFVLLNSLDKPRIEALHAPDIMRLVASGMAFGVAIMGLFGRLKFPNE